MKETAIGATINTTDATRSVRRRPNFKSSAATSRRNRASEGAGSVAREAALKPPPPAGR